MRSIRWWITLPIVAVPLLAAAETVDLGGRTYERDGEGWVQLDPAGRFPVEPGVVTVRFAAGIPTLEDFRAVLLADGGDSELAQLPPIRANRLGIHDLALMTNQDPLDIAGRLIETGLVEFAEPSTLGLWAVTPSDPRYPEQWHLENTGQSGGVPDGDIDADEAWDVETGSPGIVVAIVDSGTDIDHVDLLDNLWKNTGETPSNNQDDDNNGFVDDYDGWDFEGNDGNPRSSNSHGTQVAGIVASRTDNGTGVAGVAGGFGADAGSGLMPLKVGTAGPIGSVLDDAILYAADNGAQIITMSLTVGQTAAIDNALDYAYNTRGVFIDCASGNSGGGSVSYPARNANVMAVGATTRNDVRASYSQYGSDLEVVAPGSSILSTTLNNGYASGSGTSFAAPNVAGVAALILSYNPNRTNDQVRQTLKDSADDIGDPGVDIFTGHGRINARVALDMTPPPICTDADADGFYSFDGCGSDVDCDDSDPDVYPGAPEVCDDGIDQDCDGVDKTKGKGCGKGGSGGGDKEQCKNGVDDDGDTLVDCADPDCASKRFCN